MFDKSAQDKRDSHAAQIGTSDPDLLDRSPFLIKFIRNYQVYYSYCFSVLCNSSFETVTDRGK